jgi:hypothetical protein
MRALRLSAGLVAAALPMALAGCSSSGSTATAAATTASSATASATASASSVSASAPADPDAGLLTGARLKAALVSTGIPAGFVLDASGSVDTGSTYQAPSASSGKPDCSNLGATGWVDLSGYGGVSFAQNDYVNKDSTEEFAQEVDVYRGETAQAVMTALAKLATVCPSYSDSSTSSTVKVSVVTGTSLGQGTVTIELSDPKWSGGTTLVAVRVGHAVVTVLDSAASGSGASYADTLAAQLTANVEKAQN